MYVCVCNAVTERQIEEAVENGAKTVKDLNAELGVGSDCGSCVSCAKACLKAAKQTNAVAPKQIIPIASAALIESTRRI